MNSSKSKLSDITLRVSVYVALFFIATVFSLALVFGGRDASVASASIGGSTIDLPALGNADIARHSYANVVGRVAPTVVTIRSEGRARATQQLPLMDDPSLRDFFGQRGVPQQQPRREQRRRSGLGSGVIVSRDGYILTNHHVIAGAEKIRVQLTDNRTFDAKVVGSDPPSDLAVLKVEANDLPVLPLGNSDEVRVGDMALAVGNPLGVGQTVTSGIISAKGRSTGTSDGGFEDFLQTDASINQGNSGGALVNATGELIGINSQILSPSGGNIGIGFAIPSNMAKGVMEQLVKNGKVSRSQLGVTVQPVTSEIAASLGLKNTNGVIISSVQPGSSAAQAGIKQGDVIVALSGAPVVDANSFRNRVASIEPNSEVALTVMREGREEQLSATLAERPSTGNRREGNAQNGSDSTGGKLGIAVEPLTAELASQMRLASGVKGLVVREVNPEGAAAEAGLQQGDVIVTVNRQGVSSVNELRAVLEGTENRPVLMLINRSGNNLYLTIRLR